MLNVHVLSGLDDKEIYHTFIKVISQCHMLAYLEAINHIFVFPEELFSNHGRHVYIIKIWERGGIFLCQISIKWPYTQIGLETLQYLESISQIPLLHIKKKIARG
ncbi:hypothetical protein GmHk_14G041486 [Glycine max]|nr:hypothetical protein GmHk_14G041486 [Glycine max]